MTFATCTSSLVRGWQFPLAPSTARNDPACRWHRSRPRACTNGTTQLTSPTSVEPDHGEPEARPAERSRHTTTGPAGMAYRNDDRRSRYLPPTALPGIFAAGPRCAVGIIERPGGSQAVKVVPATHAPEACCQADWTPRSGPWPLTEVSVISAAPSAIFIYPFDQAVEFGQVSRATDQCTALSRKPERRWGRCLRRPGSRNAPARSEGMCSRI